MENKLPFLLLYISFTLIPSLHLAQGNDAPKVEIISPSENVTLEGNSIVPYSIVISDKEDGNSEYDEINENEVILTVTYLPDASKAEKYVEEEIGPRSAKLSLIAASNCFTCHLAKDKLIGPSFEDIVREYDPISESRAYLIQKISQGSSGIWSDEIMPGQPELEKEKIAQMLEWIFTNAQDPNYTFYSGTEGAFKTRKRQNNKGDKDVYVLHALYADHGINESFERSKKGTHTVMLNFK